MWSRSRPLRHARAVLLSLRVKKKGGRYEKYREAWDLMKEEPDDRTLASSRALGH